MGRAVLAVMLVSACAGIEGPNLGSDGQAGDADGDGDDDDDDDDGGENTGGLETGDGGTAGPANDSTGGTDTDTEGTTGD